MLSLEGAYALSLAVSAAAVVGGTVATYWYDHESTFLWRLPTGACAGLAALGLIGFFLAMRYGLTSWVVVLAGVIAAAPIGLLSSTQYRQGVVERSLGHHSRGSG